MAKVRTRKRGKTYSYIFEAGKKPDGKRKVVEKGGFPTADEAYIAGVEAYTDFRHGNIGVTSERMPLADFLELYLKRVAKDIRPNTLINYEKKIRIRISPYIGDIILQELRPAEIDQWLQKLYNEGLSKGYISSCRSLLKAALDYAVYPCELIQSNACIYAKVPKNAPTQVIERKVISPQQFDQLMKDFPAGDLLHIPVAIMYHTGMRLGEVLGLTWEDIDFAEKSISINKQLIYQLSGKVHLRITRTKTEQSKRKIYANDELMAELAAERNRQAGLHVINVLDKDGFCYSFSDELARRPGFTKINLVCVYPDGRAPSRHMITSKLHAQGINSHSFRHTQATKLISAGIQPMTAARRLGHSKPGTTINVYTHDSETLQKSAVSILDQQERRAF